MDENCERLSYMDFLSAFDQKAEKKSEPPPSSPDAVRQIESLDGLSPRMALARMRELVTASAPNLYKVKPKTTQFSFLHSSVSLSADHLSATPSVLQAFLAFDQSKTGMVKALEFRQVLNNFCARLPDKQYRYMLTKLELDCESCTINWKDFLNKFESQDTLVREACLQDT